MPENDELKLLSEQILKLNKHLDERVKTIEERQDKTETKISQGGPVAAEARAELTKINDKISSEIKEYRKLVLEQKEAMLALQRPPPTNGYRGSTAGSYKPMATRALEKWMRKGGDASALPWQPAHWKSGCAKVAMPVLSRWKSAVTLTSTT